MTLQFNILWTSRPNHKNLGTENTKVKNDNIQSIISYWKGVCERCNAIILILKLDFLIPGAASELFASWWKDRSFLSTLNHAATFSPAEDLWHLSRFDPSTSQPKISRENFLITQIKMFPQSLWWKLNSFTFNFSFLWVPWQYCAASPSGEGCIVNRLKIHFSSNYFLPSSHLHTQSHNIMPPLQHDVILGITCKDISPVPEVSFI